MSDYSYVIDNIKFSYSSLSTFGTCAYSWYLTYINEEARDNNFFGQYGSLIHEVLETYWEGKVERENMAGMFKSLFDTRVNISPPPFPKNMEAGYYNDGVTFFESFDMNRDEYDVLMIEGLIRSSYKDIPLVVKPDLLLRHKETGEVFLMDYKTAKPIDKRTNTLVSAKIAEYEKQLLLYAYFINKERTYKVDKISLLFVRLGIEHFVEVTEEKVQNTLDWLETAVNSIRAENEFVANTSNAYFCNNLCSVRRACKFWRAGIK